MPVGPGTILQNRYEVKALLDSGGMGQVWRGEDGTLRRGVAIKVMRSDYANQESFERFVREAQFAAGLDHPGITSVYDFGRHEGQYFIVMQLLRGRDLKAVLKEHPVGLPVQQAVGYAIQAAEALAAAHENGVIHRDLKPANLFIVADDRLKICDFGIAKHADATRTLTPDGKVVGTPAYMSPEQWEGSRVDARSDLYSLGCVLYELLTGRPPFGSDLTVSALRAQHLQVIPEPPQTDAHLPAPLSNLVLGMLAKDPAARLQTATALAEALKEIDLAPPPPPRAAPPVPEPACGTPGALPEPMRASAPSSTTGPHPSDWVSDPGSGASPAPAIEKPDTASVELSIGPQRGPTADGLWQPTLSPEPDDYHLGWRITPLVLAWAVCLIMISLAIGAPFGVEPLVWLWMLVPSAAVTTWSAFINTVDAFVAPEWVGFDSGGHAASTLIAFLAAGGGTIAFATGHLPSVIGIPIVALSSMVVSALSL